MTRRGQKQLFASWIRRISFFVFVAGVVLHPLARLAWAAAGDLDPAFDREGRRTFVSSTTEDRGLAVAVQTDGKIVVVGDTDFFGTLDALVMRFHVNGSADSTFDSDGRRIYREPRADDHGQAVAIQADGKLVVAGYSSLFGTNDALMLRFTANGGLDTTFDRDGRRIFNSNGDDRIYAVAIHSSNGKIVAAGNTTLFGTNDILVLRFLADGRLDSSFAGDGSLALNLPADDFVRAIALQSDNKIIVVGYTNVFGDQDFAITRFNENGSLDTTFASDGRQVIRRFGDDHAQAVALEPTGNGRRKIVVAGYSNAGGSNDFVAVRLNPNGSLDSSFHADGQVVISSFGGDDRAQAIALQADGKIILAGYTDASGTNDFAVARLHANGNLDEAFGTDGRVVTRSFGGDDRALGVAVSPVDGKIVAAGYTDGLGSNDVAVARYLVK